MIRLMLFLLALIGLCLFLASDANAAGCCTTQNTILASQPVAAVGGAVVRPIARVGRAALSTTAMAKQTVTIREGRANRPLRAVLIKPHGKVRAAIDRLTPRR